MQAPEIFLAKTYDSKVDLWSVGVILYGELFTEHVMYMTCRGVARISERGFPAQAL